MIVAMIAVSVVQVAIDQVVHMIAVWDGFMATTRTVLVRLVVGATGVLRRATRRIASRHGQLVFLDASRTVMVQMAVVEIIHVAVVLNGGVAAAGTVLMRVARVQMSCTHRLLSFLKVVILRLHGTRRGCFQLVRVRQGVVNKIGHVPIRQRVKQVRSRAPPHDQSFTS